MIIELLSIRSCNAMDFGAASTARKLTLGWDQLELI
jgi:hypothetical protein